MMRKGKVYLVGAGIGGPDMITVRGLDLLKNADVVVYDRLLNKDLLKEVHPTAEKIDVGKIASLHAMDQNDIQDLLVNKAKEGKMIVRLKGGDPYVFGRGGEEAEYLFQYGIEFEVVPGLTSGSAALCYAGIPATHREYASSLHFITGHKKNDDELNYPVLSKLRGTLVFYMGHQNAKAIQEGLLTNGMDPHMPAGFISRGGYPDQEVLITSLEKLHTIRDKVLKSPVLMVIGEVLHLRKRLNFFENTPLFGKKIIVTRARNQNSRLAKQLKNLGAEVIEMPVIQVKEQNIEQLQTYIDRIEDYTHIGFTSMNGVHIFMKTLLQKYDVRKLAHCKLCAIGDGTATAFAQYGLKADLIPESFVAESMADTMLSELDAKSKVLLPRAAQGREVLKGLLEKKCIVDEVPIYDVVKEPLDHELKEFLYDNSPDFITFTSSSTVKNTKSIFQGEMLKKLQEAKAISIGPITSQSVIENGFNLTLEAPVHTVQCLVDALVEYCRKV